MKDKHTLFFHRPLYKWGFLVLFSILGCISTQCKSQENKERSGLDRSEKPFSIQQDTLTTETFNPAKTMVLRVEKIRSQERPMASINYAVYSTKTQKLLKKDSFEGTDVQWNDSSSLKLIPYIGMERKPVSENPDEVVLDPKQERATIIQIKDSL